VQRMLISIRAAFDQPVMKDDLSGVDPDKQLERIETKALLAFMLADETEEWDAANRGRPITAYWLRNSLRGLLDPPGARDWATGPADKRIHHSGYERGQFKLAWESYLADVKASGTTAPDQNGETPADPPAAPDAPEAPDELGLSTENATGKPNGADRECEQCGGLMPDRRFRRYCSPQCRAKANEKGGPKITLRKAAVLEAHREHPDWGPAKLAKQLGQPRSFILKCLGQ
jgi:hypothetical protein